MTQGFAGRGMAAIWRTGAGGAAAILFMVLAGCSSYLPSAGPSFRQVERSVEPAPTGGLVKLVDITDSVARKVLAAQTQSLFSDSFGTATAPNFRIGPGDVVEVSIWESPPASLFGGGLDVRSGASTSRSTVLPEQMVNSQGSISVPFVGMVRAAGRTPQEIGADIEQALKGKANQPQALVRITRNASLYVTVIGEVSTSGRMPLTAQGERLLDALAMAGGTKQPVGKMTLQVTRGNMVRAMPLGSVIEDPRQNVVLQPGDVVTALNQPLSFTVLGATTRNEEINFEAQGITLAQALGRAGGLQDARADARAVFIFRFEDPAALIDARGSDGAPVMTTPEGRVPVIYRVDLKDPQSFFVAQGFPIRHRDVMYVANAPAAELQKFLNIVSSVVVPAVTVRNLNN
ncbi:MAG: polysaccharide biosynthesis/export family protein [Pseudomonadota bacterium]